ncbi:DNA helicase rad5 [Malassezia sp. CBS 17886]|nr:DNA helicase rad5 [Malassezia sp. CBS 17886]
MASPEPRTGEDAPLFFLDAASWDARETRSEPDALRGTKRAAEERAAERADAWRRRYLGTFVLCAYSMTKGAGCIHAGERVLILRKHRTPPAANGARAAPRRGFSGKPRISAPDRRAASRGRADYVVRFSNTRGFEIGRIPVEVAGWMATLMDDSAVEFDGFVVDCPSVLHVGCDILLEVRAYVLRSAFEHRIAEQCNLAIGDAPAPTAEESAQERRLRMRKVSLNRLLRTCNVTPARGGGDDGVADDGDRGVAEGRTGGASAEADRACAPGDAAPGATVDPACAPSEPEAVDGTEMSAGRIHDIYRRAQQHDANLAEVEPPATFALTLRPYQKQALGWMQEMETAQSSSNRTAALHPLWEEYQFPGGDDADAGHETFYLNPYIGDLSLDFQPASRGARGGILADEMGLGKTIMLASLIHAERAPTRGGPCAQEPPRAAPRGRALRQTSLAAALHGRHTPRVGATKATLVVAPMSLLSQWQSELERASAPGTLTVQLYYGDAREQLARQLEQGGVDVVVTSYGTLTSEYRRETERAGASLLLAEKWHRVILDEAHNIKNRATLAARASYMVAADRRWALTGTPIQNRLTDLYSLLRFLQVEPWGDVSFFNSFLAKPFAAQSARALEIVQSILASLLLRREKHTRGRDGQSIVELPRKTLDTQRLTFSAAEREIYNSVYDRAQTRYRRLLAQGLVARNFSLIFSVLMRLRQAVCHPLLVLHADRGAAPQEGLLDDAADEERYQKHVRTLITRFQASSESGDHAYALDVLGRLADAESADGDECPFCMEQKMSKCFLPLCMHHGCRDCLVQYLQGCEDRGEEPHCPVCRRGPVQAEDLVESVRARERAGAPRTPPPPVRSSTKLDALRAQLDELRASDPCLKAVIFSQFTAFLDVIEAHLRHHSYEIVRLDGRTPQAARARVLATFTETPRPMLILVSLRAGGVGLNLSAANHVWLMDCWWNSAIEDQAVDRIHRLGQTRPVVVHRLLVENTIEDRILAIQQRKRTLVQDALAPTKGRSMPSEALENLEFLFADGPR